MKGPHERAIRRAAARVPGGKALARLRFFEEQRELPEIDVKRGAPRQPLTAAPDRAGRARESTGRRADETSPYLAAFERKEALAAAARAAPIQQGWRPIGPFSIPHGQTYGEGRGSRPSISGRVSAVAVDPGNANHILIGAAGGGVWETKDGGATWQPRTDDQPSLFIGAVVFNPSNPSVAYAGTGEGNSRTVLGAGLLRSTDGGTTWALHARAPFEGIGFYDLVVDPLDGNHLLAATTSGLFESTNGGTSWTRRRAQLTWDLSMRPPVSGNPNSTKEVFAACADGVFRSTNGGTSWTAVNLPGLPSNCDRVEVCHAPSDGNVVYVFAAGPPEIPDPEPPHGPMPTPYLWRRRVFGGPFAAFAPPRDLQTGQAWYDWFAAVAPNNPDVLYLGAINVHKGIRQATGRWTWSKISAKVSGDSIHPDQHAIGFSPADPNVVYIGCDGGVYRTLDGGTTWRSLNKGLCITEFEFLAQHPQFEAFLIAGTQDNGTVRYEGEEVWYHVADGDGGDCGLNAASPYTCYHSYYYLGLERSTRGGSWGSWSWIGPLPPNSPERSNALFYPPTEVNGSVVAQAGAIVYISRNSGTTWTPVPLPAGAGRATALAIPVPTRIYVAAHNRSTGSARIYRIDFSNGTWQAPVQLTQPRPGFVSDLLEDPTNPNRLWVTYSTMGGSHVYRSDNAGNSWVDVSAGLPNIPVNAIEVDPMNPDTVYIGADVGVYRSANAGGAWTAFSTLLPNALVKDLVFHQPSRLLRAATQSRGVWEIAVDQATMPDVEAYLRDTVVDTGRLIPSVSGANDPFNVGAQIFWWQCADVKVDSPSYQRPSLADVDFETFADDRSLVDDGIEFASGLVHENPQRGRTTRVYVRVRNRGLNPARNVAVKVFFADAAVSLPPLPTGFWANFPNNVVAADSPWQPIASHKVVPTVEAGWARIVGFEWAVPATVANNISLLAVISADNDPIATTELNIGTLVPTNKQCGLKSLAVVNPPPSTGPRIGALHLNLWRAGESRRYSLGVDRAASAMLRGVVLSKRLSNLAKKAGVKQVELTDEDQAELARLVEATPALKGRLDLKTAYSPRKGVWLESFELDGKRPEPLVVLLSPKARRGQGSIVQWAEDGTVVGGFTLQAAAMQ